MRKFLTIILLPLLLASCKKENLTVTFLSDHEMDIVIESGSILNLPFNVPTPDTEVNSEGEFEENDTRVDKIQEAKLTYINLEITDPPSETFSFLKEIHLFINADGLGEVLFASKENISNDSSYIELDLTDTDFAPYLKTGKFKIRTNIVTDETITKDITVHASYEFRVVSQVLN